MNLIFMFANISTNEGMHNHEHIRGYMNGSIQDQGSRSSKTCYRPPKPTTAIDKSHAQVV